MICISISLIMLHLIKYILLSLIAIYIYPKRKITLVVIEFFGIIGITRINVDDCRIKYIINIII